MIVVNSGSYWDIHRYSWTYPLVSSNMAGWKILELNGGCKVQGWTKDWWYTYPSEKHESQLGWLFPIFGKTRKCSKPPTSHKFCKIKQAGEELNNFLMKMEIEVQQNPKKTQKTHGIVRNNGKNGGIRQVKLMLMNVGFETKRTFLRWRMLGCSGPYQVSSSTTMDTLWWFIATEATFRMIIFI